MADRHRLFVASKQPFPLRIFKPAVFRHFHAAANSNRLVLRVDGEETSEIAIGEKGAERLLGKGHLAAKLEGAERTLGSTA